MYQTVTFSFLLNYFRKKKKKMEASAADKTSEVGIPKETAFSIMFVTAGMVCFIWQVMTSGEMFYKTRKPIVAIVFAQATLGVIVTFVTLLTSLVYVDCTFVSIQCSTTYTMLTVFFIASFILCSWR